MDSPTDDLSMLLSYIDSARDASLDARRYSERDRDYYDGKQITDDEASDLKKRGQPIVVSNRIKRKIDYLTGLEIRQRTDPKAFPRNPDDEEAANAATDALRYVADRAKFAEISSAVWENMIIEGSGGCEVYVEQVSTGIEICIEQVTWDRIFYDPKSRHKDFRDSKYWGQMIWLDFEDAKARWPNLQEKLDTLFSKGDDETYRDKPDKVWVDGPRRRVRVAEIHFRRLSVWHRAVLTESLFLEEPAPSQYLDEEGRPQSNLFYTSAYVDRENNRYGYVREMITVQDEINKRRSRALHLMNTRQAIAEQGAVEDVDKARLELTKADGYLEIAPNMRFEIAQTQDMVESNFRFLQEAKQELDLVGPNAALQGKIQGDISGRAIIAQQQGGSVELEPLLEAHRKWKRRVYTAIWNAIRQYWTNEKWVRVTDSQENLKWVGLNVPVTLEQKLEDLPQEEVNALVAQNQWGEGDFQKVVEVRNQVTELYLDINIEEGPDISSLQGEQFEMLAKMAGSGVPIPPDIILMASSLRNKDEIIKRLQPPQDQMQENQQKERMSSDLDSAQKLAKVRMMEAQTQAKLKGE